MNITNSLAIFEEEGDDDLLDYSICDVCLKALPETSKYWYPKMLEYIKIGLATRYFCKECTNKTTRSGVRDRTPKWANKAKIKRFYENCPKGHEVDHIVPLHGKNVSGLHVIDNLQYLPISINRQKGNKFFT